MIRAKVIAANLAFAWDYFDAVIWITVSVYDVLNIIHVRTFANCDFNCDARQRANVQHFKQPVVKYTDPEVVPLE